MEIVHTEGREVIVKSIQIEVRETWWSWFKLVSNMAM